MLMVLIRRRFRRIRTPQRMGAGREVHKTGTSPKRGRSPEEDSRVSIVGNLVISKRIVDTLRRTGIVDDVEPIKNYDEQNTSTIATSEEELLFQASVNPSNLECSWVVDSGASFHLTPKREWLSSYTTGDYGYVKMGNDYE